MRTCETIIKNFTERVSNKESIPPDEWLTAAIYLNILQAEEKNKLFLLEQEYVKKVLEETERDVSHAVAEKIGKTTQEWLEFKKQEAFCKQIEEFIRLAKKHAVINQQLGG